MGLSVAISGGITMLTIMLIFGVMSVLLFEMQVETISSSQAFDNNDMISKTTIDILDVNVSSSSSLVNFTLINQGSEKLWNFDHFDVLVTYDANILGTKTLVTEQFTYNATAFDKSPGQSVPSRDFKIQRGELIMLTTEIDSTITEGVDFDECIGDCFIKLVNSRLTGNGRTVGGANIETDDFTTYISNDIGLRSTGLDVTFSRHDTEGDSMDNRLQWEIWEYIGKNETGNKIIVWDTGTCTYETLNVETCDGASIPEFTGADDRVVVFITGQANPQGNLGNYPDCMNTSEWIGGANIPRFTRIGGNGNTICDLSYAVVEFSGNNWFVQRIEHFFTNNVLQIETIADVGDIKQAFFHYQQRNVDVGSSDDARDAGPEVQLSNSTSITYGLPQSTVDWGPNMQSVTWIISNSKIYSSEKLIVEHVHPPEWRTLPAPPEEENWQIAITQLTRDTSETVLTGLTAQTNSNGGNWPRGFFSAILTDSTTVDLYQADVNHDLEYNFQVVQLPGSHKCIDGKSFIIESGEWTINCIMYDDFEPGILNPNEVAEFMLKLDHPVFTNGFLEFSISTDNGNSAIKTTKGT